MRKIMFVNGMMCDRCKTRTEKALTCVKGVRSAVADLEEKCVFLEVDDDTDEQLLNKAVASAGFEPAGFDNK